MDLNRYICVGLDPKKSDYAACSFANLKDASVAVIKYKKLGVTPILLDLARVFPFTRLSHAQADVVIPMVTATSINPTNCRLPRWLLLSQPKDTDGECSFRIGTDIEPIKTTALALAGQNNKVAIVAINNALMLYSLLPSATKVGDRVDVDVSSFTIDSLWLLPQFIVAVLDTSAPCDPAANDGVVGLNGHRWRRVIKQTDSLTDAFASAKGEPYAVLYDRDNDYLWTPPWDEINTPVLSNSFVYLGFERKLIENEIRRAVGESNIQTQDDLIDALKHTQVALRRSGQTGVDVAATYGNGNN